MMRVLLKDHEIGSIMAVEVVTVDALNIIDCGGKLFDVGSCVRFEDTTGDEIWVVTDDMTSANTIVEDCFHHGKIDLTRYSDSTIFYPTLEDDIDRLLYFADKEHINKNPRNYFKTTYFL